MTAAHLALLAAAVTGTVHAPRNDALKAVEGAGSADLGAARRAFDERLGSRWNLLRVVASVGALAWLGWALTLLP